MKRRLLLLGATLACSLLSACHSIGPGTVARDRFDYSSSISESWKRQTLLNIVKLRYLDPPIFVDVGQIVAGYSLETALTAGGTLPENSALGGNTATVGGSVRYTDRPTITYTPLTGDKFVKALMTPLPPESVFFTIQSGWPADAILFTAVARINGLRNQEASLSGLTLADPRFMRVLELMRQLQVSGAVGMRVEQDAQKHENTLLTFRTTADSAEARAASRELRELLSLAPDVQEFNLVFGAASSTNTELAVQTRSLLHILTILAAQVEVPPEHVDQGRAAPGAREAEKDGATVVRVARIQSSKGKPGDAYVAVPYRDHWFWIDDRDLKSKRAFAFMMMLFTLSDNGQKEPPPMITIPAQ